MQKCAELRIPNVLCGPSLSRACYSCMTCIRAVTSQMRDNFPFLNRSPDTTPGGISSSSSRSKKHGQKSPLRADFPRCDLQLLLCPAS